MPNLSQIEKGIFMKLFNRSGYVLNFSTNDFDVFTMESVGVPLCETYKLSKGKSLMAYINEASDYNTVKLLKDLLDYYEVYFECEIENDGEYSKTYYRCKDIMARILYNKTPLASVVVELKEKFSSAYLSAQIDLMLKMQSENPTEAIGKAKELVESCCKTILDENEVVWEKNWDVGQLTGAAVKLLKLMPKDIPDTAPASGEMKSILGNLRAIATNLAALRNPYGSGHGKSATYKGLEERHAKLAVGSSITLVSFLWDTYESRGILNRETN
ncbi:abortive infection family protein [Bacillus massilinigeriensis]|uniref:abortive infection family protein n=1 Tax=Bacillus massilionigeriensis TaxID=1805475 RepID=UPI00096B2F8D|nr:abortive infection family protein [Bacillus massilionigeriensis]